MTQQKNFLFSGNSSKVALIKSGYCWQYLLPDQHSESDYYICSLKKAGEYVFFAQCFGHHYREAIEIGLSGCDFEWVPLEEVSTQQRLVQLNLNKSYFLTYLRLYYSTLVRRNTKCISPVERKLEQALTIGPSHQTSAGNTCILELNQDFSIFVPLNLRDILVGEPAESSLMSASHNLSTNIKTSKSELSNLSTPYLDTNLEYVNLIEDLRSYINQSLSYGILYESLTTNQQLKDEFGIKTALESLNLTLQHSREKNISQDLQNTSDFKLLFKNQELIDYGLNLNHKTLGSSFKQDFSLYTIPSITEKKLDFYTFFKELQQKPFSLGLIIALSLFIQLLTLAVPLLFQQIIDKVISQQNPPLLPILTTVMIVSALLAGIFRSSRQLIVFDVADRADEKFSEIILKKLINLKYDFFGGQKKGDIASRIQDVSNIRAFFTGPVISTSLDLLFSVVYLSILLLYSVNLTIAAFAPMPVYMALVVIGAPYYKRLVRKRAAKRAYLFSFILEVISGIQSVKLQGFGSKAIELWRNKFYEQQDVGLKLTTFASVFSEIGAFCTQLSSILILFFGTTLVLSGDLTVGELIAFRIIAGFLTAPLLRLSGIWQSVQETQISLERVNKIIDYESENVNYSSFVKGDPRKILVRNIEFGYSPKQSVLYDVSALFSPGTSTALVGKSGSGKTTLIKLLTGLYDLDAGAIEIGGTNIENISSKKLREMIYCVPQESHFIGGTIEDNIRYGYPKASQEDLNDVLELVCLQEITESKLGVNGLVQEGGSNFSGGQKQRLALARMILRNPSCIILDEATSALDSITEAKILKNLSIKFPSSTVIYITHRIHTASKADQIIMLENGVVAGSGPFQKLYNSLPSFKEMVDRGVNE